MKLSQNTISSQGIEHIIKGIQTNTTLQVLDISHNNVYDDGITEINECLEHNKALTLLNVAGNNITKKGVKVVTDFMQMNTLPNPINFSTTMNENEAVAISQPLKIKISESSKVTEKIQLNIKLERLDISHNYISDEGAIIVSGYLKLNGTLKELNLCNNKITGDGIIKMLMPLK